MTAFEILFRDSLSRRCGIDIDTLLLVLPCIAFVAGFAISYCCGRGDARCDEWGEELGGKLCEEEFFRAVQYGKRQGRAEVVGWIPSCEIYGDWPAVHVTFRYEGEGEKRVDLCMNHACERMMMPDLLEGGCEVEFQTRAIEVMGE